MSKKSSQTLRLTQSSLGQQRYRVEIALESETEPRRIATSEFSFNLSLQDREDIRWYLEDYLQYPLEPAPKIAARIERRMAEIGADLFKKIFHHNEDTRRRWADAADRLNETRVEIVSAVDAIPWELTRDPENDMVLALGTHAFVRASHQAAQTPRLTRADSGTIRILLVICRPRRGEDVPFRSVASRLIKGLDEAARENFQLDVLRPPTFEALAAKLRAAKEAGGPYHVVHFDGHGAFLDMEDLFDRCKEKTREEAEALLARLVHIDPQRFFPETIYPNPRRPGQHGYLAFDNTRSEYNLRLVDAAELGALLADTGVSVLVLNACRSAYAEAPEQPETVSDDAPRNIHADVRTYGSFAEEVLDKGVAGLVAMRYAVYVVAAAQFVANLYAGLVRGRTLGEAVTLCRKQLAAQPLREIAFDARPLQDWCVPVVYEAAPIALFPELSKNEQIRIEIKPEDQSTAAGQGLPSSPDTGFFGRDETLLALDRAFDTQSVVLLHGLAGSGKTATVIEFARWYRITGGLGPTSHVLFTPFQHYHPLDRVINELEPIYERLRTPVQRPWFALEAAQRREVALQILSQTPILWIWDNVEPVTGFPAEAGSVWSLHEQQELADFLRAAHHTMARFLLTSRRDEQEWLHELPARVVLPPMPMRERFQLARAIVKKHSRRPANVDEWRALLRFTQGNPLTILVVVGQAFRDGLKKREQMEAFLDKLRSGEAEIEDDESEGRSRSLTASLRYGFEHAFTEEEQKILALLHLYQGHVDAVVLSSLGHSGVDWSLPETRGLTREAAIGLLDRLAETGLLTAYGAGIYDIHPAVPYYFKELFDTYYPDAVSSSANASNAQSATRAFLETMGQFGNDYHNQYEEGHQDVIALIAFEEENLLHACQLAQACGSWPSLIDAMQGLRHLYHRTGRRAEWKRLVEETVPYFVDPANDGALPGREEQWCLVTEYRVRLAEQEFRSEEAERLHCVLIEWNRQRAREALQLPVDSLDRHLRNEIRSLAVSLEGLGWLQLERGHMNCLDSFKEALSLSERIAERSVMANCAFGLGRAYFDVSDIRDLDRARVWLQRSLELRDKSDRLGQARCLGQLGNVARLQFYELYVTNTQSDEQLKYLNEALRLFHKVLNLTPPDAIDNLAVAHSQIGATYGDAGDVERALTHVRKGIQYMEAAGNILGAAKVRANTAAVLMKARRFADASAYAETALRSFEDCGDRATQQILHAKRLIATIEDQRTEGG